MWLRHTRLEEVWKRMVDRSSESAVAHPATGAAVHKETPEILTRWMIGLVGCDGTCHAWPAAAMVIVILLQGIFVLWTTVRVDKQSRRFDKATRITADFEAPKRATERERQTEHRYLLSPSPVGWADYGAARDRLRRALVDVKTAVGSGEC